MQARDMVVAVFDDRDDAVDAIEALKDAGFAPDQVSVAARDKSTTGAIAGDTGTEAGAGAATGALAGGLLGGAAGWLIGIGALAIPGVGPFIAAGPLAAALGGAALGAAGGGLIGALTGAGIPEDEAKYYDERVQSGGILVSVNAPGRYDEARRVLHDYSGHDYERGMQSSSSSYRSWNDTAPEFRSRYESSYGANRYGTAEPAARFGYESYGRMRGSGSHKWESDEPTLRSEWERSNQGTWDQSRSDVRRGYDYGRGRHAFRDGDGENAAATAGGSVVGGAVGAVAGGLVAGPPGAVAGGLVGGSAGAAAGDAASDGDDMPGADTPRRSSTMRESTMRDEDTTRRSSTTGRATEGENQASTAGGSAVGGATGAVVGGLVAGPPGAVAGAAIGGTAGAASGDAAVESDEEARERKRRGDR